MIRATFRINVGTTPERAELLTPSNLCKVFKCASAGVTHVENDGLPASQDEAAEEDEEEELPSAPADQEEPAEERDEAAEAARRAAKVVAYTANGRAITQKALDTYRETIAQRRAFGIPNTKRTNIDTERTRLRRILAEPIDDIVNASPNPNRPLPKTQRQRVDEATSRFPKQLPELELRVSILHRPLWQADDPVARQNWKKVVVPQTLELTHELERDLLRLETNTGFDPDLVAVLQFERLNLRFDRFVVSLANPRTNRFGDVEEALRQVYERVNDGTFGDAEPARIDIPFIDYGTLEHQIRAAQEQKAAEEAAEAEKAAEEEAARAQAAEADEADALPQAEPEQAQAEGQADAEGTEDVEEAEGGEDEADDEPIDRNHGIAALRMSDATVAAVRQGERLMWQQAAQERAERQAALEKAQEDGTAVDFGSANERVWGVVFLDGSIRYFDPQIGEFCDMPEPDPEPVDDAGIDAESAPVGADDGATIDDSPLPGAAAQDAAPASFEEPAADALKAS